MTCFGIGTVKDFKSNADDNSLLIAHMVNDVLAVNGRKPSDTLKTLSRRSVTQRLKCVRGKLCSWEATQGGLLKGYLLEY